MSQSRLFKIVKSCDRCYSGKEIYAPAPDPNNADDNADIIFINERPGRIGTGESEYVSFDNADPTADFLKNVLNTLN